MFDNSELPGENDGRPTALEAGGGSSTVTAPNTPFVGNGGRAGPVFDPNGQGGLGPRDLDQVP